MPRPLRTLPLPLAALSLALLFVLPAGASAAERYAAPGGATSGACSKASPCRIDYAVNAAASGDEILVAPGQYEVASGLVTSEEVTVRGEAGAAAKPRIVSGGNGNTLSLEGGGRVTDLELVYAGSAGAFALLVGPGSTVERVVARSSGTATLYSAAGSTIRDSALFNAGVSGTALALFGSGSNTVRNVTTIATGPESTGLGLRTLTTASANVRNSIARGTRYDVEVEAINVTATASLDLDYSNFRADKVGKFGPATLTLGPHNQDGNSAPPLFADLPAGNVRQLPGSPTIDAGLAAGDLGALDLAGNPRVLGPAPDIGADEFVPPNPAPVRRSPEPPPPGSAPSLTGLARTKAVFLPGYLRRGASSPLPRNTLFSFFVNQKATVTVVFKRVLKGRLATRGQLTRAATTGKNRIRFGGLARSTKGAKRRLAPGPYKAFFTSRNEFGSSPTAVVGFRVAKPPRR